MINTKEMTAQETITSLDEAHRKRLQDKEIDLEEDEFPCSFLTTKSFEKKNHVLSELELQKKYVINHKIRVNAA